MIKYEFFSIFTNDITPAFMVKPTEIVPTGQMISIPEFDSPEEAEEKLKEYKELGYIPKHSKFILLQIMS